MEFNQIAGNCRVQEDCFKGCYNCCMLCKCKKEKDCDHPTMSGRCPYFREGNARA